MRKLLILLACLLLVTPAFAATRLDDESVNKGYVNVIDCVGAGVTCTRSGIVGTLTIPGGAASGYVNFTNNETTNIVWGYNFSANIINATKFTILGVDLNNTAYSWGNHATAGYGTSNFTSNQATNTTSDVTLASGNVTGNWNVTNIYATNNKHGFTYTISNGTSVLTTGWAGYMPVMNNFTLTKSIISSTDFTAGSCTIQVKKAPPLAAGAFNLTEANNFTLCGNFTIGASNTTFVDATLTGWNTTWVTDEYIGFNITAVSGFKGVVLQGKSTN